MIITQVEEVRSSCEKCKYSIAIQRRHLKTLPRVLVLHLKRFQPSKLIPQAVDKVFDVVQLDKMLFMGTHALYDFSVCTVYQLDS